VFAHKLLTNGHDTQSTNLHKNLARIDLCKKPHPCQTCQLRLKEKHIKEWLNC